jgi:AmmeMemoRadiSam system protein A
MIGDSSEHTIDERATRFLLALARETIQCRLDGKPAPSPELSGQNLLEPRGAFVTLKIEGRLRGCIGHVIGVAPLWRAVRDNAIAAAFEDPRFEPLQAEEIDHTHIEISALTPLQRVDFHEVIVGRDGILLERGRARGLLLPQVAAEFGWGRETFLDHTCRKAGLEPGCWRHPDTVISTFSAQVFGEEEI